MEFGGGSMLKLDVVEVPCLMSRKNRFCFPCVKGLCPYGRHFEDCYEFFDDEVRELFNELVILRKNNFRIQQ